MKKITKTEYLKNLKNGKPVKHTKHNYWLMGELKKWWGK